MTLANAPVNSVFVDNGTTLNGSPIEWVVAAVDVDGQGISTLMMKTPLSSYCFDAKEPQNPTVTYQENGYSNYEKSNILQWLNSEAVNWYTPQHSNDYPPDSTNVVKGVVYNSNPGFLNGFSKSLRNSLTQKEKFNVTRKVHLPAPKEILPSENPQQWDSTPLDVDTGATYTGFNGASLYEAELLDIDLASGVYIRGDGTSTNNFVPYLYRGYTDDHYTSLLYRIYKQKAYEGYTTSASYSLYTIPVIYVDNTIPVTYNSTTQKYYHDYSADIEYADYGSHKGGFSVKIRINTADASTNATVKAYVDGSITEAKTFTVSTFNAYTALTFTDSDFEDLASGSHTVNLVVKQGNEEDNVTFTFSKIAASIPIIYTNAIGNVTQAFSSIYQISDEDGDSVDVTISLDSTQIESISDVAKDVELTLSVTASQFNALSYGNHSIIIRATDDSNTSTATIPFVKKSMPTISLSSHNLGEVNVPTSVTATYDSADGDIITITAYIDGQEISV